VPWYTIGKGGILGDMKFAGHDGDTRAQARKNVLQSYADFLYYRAEVGPLSDVPAGDVGIGGDEISVIFDRITHNALSDITAIAGNPHGAPANIKKILGEHFGVPCTDASLLKKISSSAELTAAYTSPAITGKPGPHGLALRAGATSRGLIEVLSAQQNFQDYGDAALWSDPARITEALEREVEYRVKAESKLRMLSFSIQGFGKVGANLAKMIDEIGATVKMISDVSGTLSDPAGIKGIPALFDRCFKGGLTLQQAPREITGSAEFIPGDTVMPLKAIVDVVVPAALEEVIVAGDQDESGNVHGSDFRGIYLHQGAYGPATAEAEEALEDMGTVSFPDILANAGGVLASYLEWIKGLTAVFGYRKVSQNRFVHPIAHNLILHFHPGALKDDIREIDEKAYGMAFNFILRSATIESIALSRRYRVSMRKAFLAIGIQHAAREGRLTDQFGTEIDRIRHMFAGAGINDTGL
ncbi:MAG TPA: hypothetical protein PK573_16105, partial [Spirochaetota bacterium]|nr:hypothetical protein [Spirochaetota bacterium]